jgi:endoglucanase
MRFLLLIFLTLPTLAESIRMPSEARLWLRVPEGAAPLPIPEVDTGTATRATWEKDPDLRDRTTNIQFPIRWWDWSAITLRFTPTADITVDLILSGTWEEHTGGKPHRQETHWDHLTATGTTLTNPSFEEIPQTSPPTPTGWTTPWQPYPAADSFPLANPTPFHGKHLAASWHDRPLQQTLTLRAGVPVTLTLHARSVPPPDFVKPKRLGANTPAHTAIRHLHRGVNLGNGWEAPPPYSWGIRYTTEDIDAIAAQGFDHIRVPVAWHFHLKTDPQGKTHISPDLLRDLEPVLKHALQKNLRILLDWHHFHDLTKDPATHKPTFITGWETIARHFKDWPDTLLLELLNEPCDALTTEAVNPLHAETIRAIRRIDPTRILILSPGKFGHISELDRLHLPDDDPRLIVTVHCYEPFHFTHQGAEWVNLQDLRNITFPGPPATPLPVPETLKNNPEIVDFIHRYNTTPTSQNPSSDLHLRALLAQARKWSDHFGRPIHLGEFGSITLADPASRLRHAIAVRDLAQHHQIPYTWWDWKARFAYWDEKSNHPLLPGLLKN